MTTEGYYYPSKKSDDICADVCGAQQSSSPSLLSMARVSCLLRDLDFKSILFLFLILPCSIFAIYCHGQKLTYFFRPLWQSAPKPFTHVAHFYNDNVTFPTLCSLHGWGTREFPRRVYDAVLFSNELDMLKIRWKELYPLVTRFVLLESNSTFTALPKTLNFAGHRKDFEFMEPRLTYGVIGGRFQKGENPFVEESYQRRALDKLLQVAGIEDDDLLIMSDVDEIPSRHTIDLLRWCDNIPPILHLQLRNYMYSYEFENSRKSWRTSVHRYQRGKTKYVHYRQTDLLLADSGWHCSFCFRRISDFIFKMKAYSHTDRVRFSHFLNPERIQDKICKGADLYDMLPEEYTFKDIIARMGNIPSSSSGVHLPTYLLEKADEYRYLLPGNCIRETS